MIKLISIIFLAYGMAIITPKARAMDFSLLSFNTMCDFCHKDNRDNFSERKELLRQVIEDHKADLVALQEVRTGGQVRDFFKNTPTYKLFFTKAVLMSYADPALAINTAKFKVLKNGQFWLGPGEGFSFGWKMALPRQVIWAKLKSKEDGKELYFVSGHFDNRIENLLGAADLVNQFIKGLDAPVVFAGDTNITPDFEGYSMLLGGELKNAFSLKEKFSTIGKPKQAEDLCYHRKGDKFPACRVDHILLSKGDDWKVSEWAIDVRRLGPANRFPSDHRPVFGRLSLLGLFKKHCFQHNLSAVYLSFNIGGVSSEPNIFYQGASLGGKIGPFHIKVLDDGDRVALKELGAI